MTVEKKIGELAHSCAMAAGLDADFMIANSLTDVEAAFSKPCDLLLAFGTGVIVPRYILQLPGLTAINIHAASPDFPGRDPCHFAVYRGARKYGATLHYMVDKVDQGPIVDVELFDVPEGVSVVQLLAMANAAGVELMKRFFTIYAKSGAPAARNDLVWSGKKTKRSDFLELCRVDSCISEAEFQRRLAATTMPGFENLYIDIHGYRFRIDGKTE